MMEVNDRFLYSNQKRQTRMSTGKVMHLWDPKYVQYVPNEQWTLTLPSAAETASDQGSAVQLSHTDVSGSCSMCVLGDKFVGV